MKPRGLLMIEHRLIEKVLSVAKQKAISMTDREGFRQFVAMLYTAFPDLHHVVKEQIAETLSCIARSVSFPFSHLRLSFYLNIGVHFFQPISLCRMPPKQ